MIWTGRSCGSRSVNFSDRSTSSKNGSRTPSGKTKSKESKTLPIRRKKKRSHLTFTDSGSESRSRDLSSSRQPNNYREKSPFSLRLSIARFWRLSRTMARTTRKSHRSWATRTTSRSDGTQENSSRCTRKIQHSMVPTCSLSFSWTYPEAPRSIK